MSDHRPHNAKDERCQWTHGADRCPEPSQLWPSGQRMNWCRYHENCNTNDPEKANWIMRELLAGRKPKQALPPAARKALETLRAIQGDEAPANDGYHGIDPVAVKKGTDIYWFKRRELERAGESKRRAHDLAVGYVMEQGKGAA